MKKRLLIPVLLILLILGGSWYARDYLRQLPLFTSLFGSFEQETDVSTSGLVGYWSMERNGNTLYDQSRYSNNGTITGATSVPGKKGVALSFDGTNDSVSLENGTLQSVIGTNDATYSFWVSPNTADGDDNPEGEYQPILELETDESWITYGGANRIRIFLGGAAYSSGTGMINNAGWQHFVVTFDRDGYAQFYKNGSYNSQVDISAGSEYVLGLETISSDGTGNRAPFDGLIDEVRVYNRILDTAEITALYREGTETIGGGEKGLVGHWTLGNEDETHGATNEVTNGTFTTDLTGWTSQVGDFSGTITNSSDQLRFDQGGTSEYMHVHQSPSLTEGKRYRLTGTIVEVSSTWYYFKIGTSVPTNGASYSGDVLDSGRITTAGTYSYDFTAGATNYLALEDASGFGTYSIWDNIEVYELQTKDATPYGKNGSIYQGSGGYTTDQHGQANKAYDFDGSASYINTTFNSFVSEMTFSGWAYRDNNSAAHALFGSDPATKSTFLRMESGSNNMKFWADSTQASVTFTDAGKVAEWFHWAITFNENTNEAILYINGELISNETLSIDYDATVGNFKIGGRITNTDLFNGKISDVKIFNRVLSPTEIQSLYDQYDPEVSINGLAKGLIGHWELTNKWANGTDIQDLTPNNNNGTASNVTVGGRGSDFDGADSTIPTTITSNTDFQNGFSVSAWIKPEGSGEGTGFYYGKLADKSTNLDGSNGFTWGINSSNQLSLNINGGTNRTSDTLSYGQWQHVLVTVSSASFVWHYINGVSGGSGGTSGVLSGITTANPLTIGNRSTATDRTFDGSISDVRLYNHVLSTTEITQLYNMGRPRAVPRTASFSSASSQYLSLADSGSAGSAQDFDTGTSDFAVEFWMQSTDTGIQTILEKKDHYAGIGAASNAGFSVWQNTGGYIIVSAYDTDSNAEQVYSWSPNLSNGAWRHVLIFFDRGAGNAYYHYDGSGAKTLDISGAPGSFDNTQPFKIGSPTQYFDGNISHVRFYNFPSGAPSGAERVAFEKYNAGGKGRIHPDLAPYLTEAWDLQGDTWARNESSHNLTNNGSVPFIKP